MLPPLLLLACTAAPPMEDEPAPAPAPAPAQAEPALRVVDLAARVSEFAATRADRTDGEVPLFQTAVASAHLHVIGTGQLCPLHIHRTTHEATVIVAGEATVRTVHGEGGALSTQELVAGPGTLVASPPFCGHEWDNRSGAPQGNLVLASPPFDGNLYLRDGDARMLPGTAPLIRLPEAAPVPGRTRLDAAGGYLELLVLDAPLLLEPDPAVQSVAYVSAGDGSFVRGDERAVARPGVAALLERRAAVRIEPSEGSVLTVFLFSPPRAPPA